MITNHNIRPYYLILVLFLIGFGNSCRDQKSSEQTSGTSSFENKKDPVFLRYTSGIRSILEDSKGNIWFGSHQEGVCLFNGKKMTYYDMENGLINNQIRSIYEDKNGHIWFECGQGISRYDGQKMMPFSEKNYQSKVNGII